MGSLSTLDHGRSNARLHWGGRPPSLRVTLHRGDPARDAELGIVTLSLRVVGARPPVRLYLYVNGDLVETWSDREASFEFPLDLYGPGRHAVTARTVDAMGRWAGASTVLACVSEAGAEAS